QVGQHVRGRAWELLLERDGPVRRRISSALFKPSLVGFPRTVKVSNSFVYAATALPLRSTGWNRHCCTAATAAFLKTSGPVSGSTLLTRPSASTRTRTCTIPATSAWTGSIRFKGVRLGT